MFITVSPLSEDEVLLQMNKMLGSKRFRQAPLQSRIFRLAIEWTLAGKSVTEDTLGEEIYPDTYVKNETNNIRVIARSLRKSLKKYYENEGCDDPILILLPDSKTDLVYNPESGTAYRPAFTYRIRTNTAESLKQGLHYLRSGKPWLWTSAIHCFVEVLTASPMHKEALQGAVEGFCLLSLFVAHVAEPSVIVKSAMTGSNNLMAYYPNECKSYLLRGMTCIISGNFPTGALAFKEALALDKTETESSLWYAAFLLRIGKRDKALSVIGRIALEQRFDAPLSATCAWLYYLAKEPLKLVETMSRAEGLDFTCWINRVLKCIFYFDNASFRDALHEYDDLNGVSLSSQKRSPLMGLGVLCANCAVQAKCLSQQEFETWQSRWKEQSTWDQPRIDPLQQAIGFIALADVDSAVESLFISAVEGDPLIWWIPLVKVFSHLRGNEMYCGLEDRIEKQMMEACRQFDS